MSLDGQKGDKPRKDWRSDLPFPRHWLFYLAVKISIFVFAAWLAALALGYV